MFRLWKSHVEYRFKIACVRRNNDRKQDLVPHCLLPLFRAHCLFNTFYHITKKVRLLTHRTVYMLQHYVLNFVRKKKSVCSGVFFELINFDKRGSRYWGWHYKEKDPKVIITSLRVSWKQIQVNINQMMLVQVSASFKLPKVQVIGIQLYIKSLNLF